MPIISSFGSYVPDNPVTNEDIGQIVNTTDEWITSRTGISKRYISLSENTSELCYRAALKILENGNLKASEIDLIIVATTTPDYLMPSTACIVQGKLGADSALAFDINAACSGFIYALSIAYKFISSESYKKALVLGGETLSKVLDWSDRRTCVLFGDGAGGILLESTNNHNKLWVEDLHSEGSNFDYITSAHMHNCIKPFENRNTILGPLKMDGRKTFEFAIKVVPKTINTLLSLSGFSINDIDYIVPHQANLRIVELVAKKLSLPVDKFYMNLKDYGNTSSASIPLVLTEMHEKKIINKNDNKKIILVGFGAGLTYGSILLQL
jgi:3-oxoacyl-[acyl-carrier-protein] synthase-3